MYPNAFYRVSVKALIKNTEGYVLVVKENQDTWSLPGGGLDHGEVAEECLMRELYEELGVRDARILGINQTRTLELTAKKAWLFWLVYDVTLDPSHIQIGEGVSEVCFIDPKTLRLSKDAFEQLVSQVAQSTSIT